MAVHPRGAIARAKALTPDEAGSEIAKLLSLVDKAITFRSEDRVQYENVTRSDVVARELGVIRDAVANLLARWQSGSRFESEPFAELAASLECRVHAEAMETLHSLLIELVAEEADQLVEGLVIDEELTGRPEMPVARLREILRNDYAWAFGLDLDIESAKRYVWYKSVSAEEPRRGPAAEVGYNVVNLGLDLPRLVVALDRDLAAADPTLSTARFLLAHPQHRAIATRVQALAGTGLHSPHADIMSGAFPRLISPAFSMSASTASTRPRFPRPQPARRSVPRRACSGRHCRRQRRRPVVLPFGAEPMSSCQSNLPSNLTVSLRELRMVFERLIQVTRLDAGLVPSLRIAPFIPQRSASAASAAWLTTSRRCVRQIRMR